MNTSIAMLLLLSSAQGGLRRSVERSRKPEWESLRMSLMAIKRLV